MSNPTLSKILIVIALLVSPYIIYAQVTLDMAGNFIASYPGFLTRTTFNWDDPISVGLESSLYSDSELSVHIYLCEHRTPLEWDANPELIDVRGTYQEHTFSGTSLSSNTVVMNNTAAVPVTYLATPGVGYDIILDVDQDGALSSADFIDGYSDTKAGCYLVGDLSQPGPFEVSTLDYSSGLYETFVVYYPSTIEQLDEQPLVVISHGWTHEYWFYDYLGELMASYGYIVMSHRNNVGGGGAANSNLASITALENIHLLLSLEETIEGGILEGKIDNNRIIHAGHSTGGECVVRAYKRLLDGEFTSEYFNHEDIVLVNSIAPVAFLSPAQTHPEGVNYHQFLGGADTDVSGAALNGYVQALSIYERGYGNKSVVYIHGAGHTDFHNSDIGPDWTDGPDLIGKEGTQSVVMPYFLALSEWYAKGNPAMEDFLTRSVTEFRPSNIENDIVISNEFRPAIEEVEYIIDDFQTNTETDLSSSGSGVTTDLEELHEILMQDYDGSFQWTGGQWSNGMTRARFTDSPRCAAVAWDESDRYLAYTILSEGADWSAYGNLSFRACQITRHPLNETIEGPVSFTITLSDANGTTSSIAIAPYGVIAPPYQRSASSSDLGTGWQNEFHSIRISLSDFTVDESGLDLSNITEFRFDLGPSFGSEKGAIGLDDIILHGTQAYSVGLSNIQSADWGVSLYPNPMHDQAYLTFDMPDGETFSYRIFDAMGKIQREVNGLSPGQVTISKGGLAPGLYLMEVQLKGSSRSIRFEIE